MQHYIWYAALHLVCSITSGMHAGDGSNEVELMSGGGGGGGGGGWGGGGGGSGGGVGGGEGGEGTMSMSMWC